MNLANWCGCSRDYSLFTFYFQQSKKWKYKNLKYLHFSRANFALLSQRSLSFSWQANKTIRRRGELQLFTLNMKCKFLSVPFLSLHFPNLYLGLISINWSFCCHECQLYLTLKTAIISSISSAVYAGGVCCAVVTIIFILLFVRALYPSHGNK